MKERYVSSREPSSPAIAVYALVLTLLCGCDAAQIVGLGELPIASETGISSAGSPFSVAGDWRVHNLNASYDSGLTRTYSFDESGALRARIQVEPGRTYTEDFLAGTVTDAYTEGDTYTSPNVLTYAKTSWVGQAVTIEIYNKLDNRVHERYCLDLNPDGTTMSGTLEMPVNGPGTFAFGLIRL